MKTVTPKHLKAMLHDGAEIALLGGGPVKREPHK